MDDAGNKSSGVRRSPWCGDHKMSVSDLDRMERIEIHVERT